MRTWLLVGVFFLAACQHSSSGSSPSFLAPGVNDLGLHNAPFVVENGVLAATVYEDGVDQNGDGDGDDVLLRIIDLGNGRNVTIPDIAPSPQPTIGGGFVSFVVPEAAEGRDLNGDGDTLDLVVHVLDVRTGETRSLGLAAPYDFVQSGTLLAFEVPEVGQGVDLDGDGSLHGWIVFAYEADLRRLTRLPFMARTQTLQLVGRRVLYRADEADCGDANADGDALDLVEQIYDADLGTLTNSGRACSFAGADGASLAMQVREAENGNADLNGNGHGGDTLVEFRDLESGFSRTTSGTTGGLFATGGGIAILVQAPEPGAQPWAYDFASDTLTPLLGLEHGGPIPGPAVDRRLAYFVSEFDAGSDLDGDGDVRDFVLHTFDGRTGVSTNTGYTSSGPWAFDARRVVFLVPTPRTSIGPLPPTSARVYDFGTRSAHDLDLVASDFRLLDDRVVVVTPEEWAGADLDADGDREDYVLQVYDLRTGRTFDTGLALDDRYLDYPMAIDREVLLIQVQDQSESDWRLLAIRLN